MYQIGSPSLRSIDEDFLTQIVLSNLFLTNLELVKEMGFRFQQWSKDFELRTVWVRAEFVKTLFFTVFSQCSTNLQKTLDIFSAPEQTEGMGDARSKRTDPKNGHVKMVYPRSQSSRLLSSLASAWALGGEMEPTNQPQQMCMLHIPPLSPSSSTADTGL